MTEVVRYVNESYIVTCLESDQRAVTWARHRDGGERAIGERGHPHILNMTKGVALVFERITGDDRGSYSCKSAESGRGFKMIVICEYEKKGSVFKFFN